MSSTASTTSNRRMLYLALAATYVATGTTFIAIKVVTDALSPFVLTMFRLLGAAFVMAPFAIWRLRQRERLPKLSEVKTAIVSGLLLFTIAQTGLAYGFSLMPAGISSVIGSAAPLFIVIFSFAIFREALPIRTVAGVLLGLAGIAALTWSAPAGEVVWMGVFALLLASASWAAGSLYAARASLPADPVVFVTLQLLSGGLMTIPLVVLNVAELPNLAALPSKAWLGLAYLVVGAVFAFQAFSWLNQNASSTIANTFLYVAPFIALVLSAVFLSEVLTVARIAAAIVALLGVTLILW